MGVLNQIPSGFGEVDVIIAGGGTAGCVVDSRLSDADPSLSILVIEGGQNNYNDPSIIHPLLFMSNLMPTSKATLFYQGTKEPKLNNRELVVPSGGILGGGSSINLLTYSRAQRQDLNSLKMPGYSIATIIELNFVVLQLETYHGPGTPETHGTDGPVQISSGNYHATTSENDFIQAAVKVGWPEKVDIQNMDTNNATQRNLRYISPGGLRQDAAHTYLYPRLQDGKHSNLHVLVEHQVVRVLFEDKKDVGVEYQPNLIFHNDTTSAKTIKAKKLVIVSARALGTPLVLERSGVGDPTILQKIGVEVVAEVPGVGRNCMDHHLLTHPYMSSLLPHETVDAIYGGRVDIGQLIAINNSMLSWNSADITSKLRPSDAEAAALGPAFAAAWNKDFKNVPNKPAVIITTLNGFAGDPSGLPYISTSTFTVHPYSRGHIHITGADLSTPLDFQTRILSDEQNIDIKMSIWPYKKQREILHRMDVYRGEYALGHPPFPAQSDASCKEFDGPLKGVKDIVYTPEDDEILEQWVGQNVGSTWHSIGTCKMAPQAEFGVVDATLGVYGAKGLKLADLGISPQNLVANTANTAFVVGEKAAGIFIKELGLQN